MRISIDLLSNMRISWRLFNNLAYTLLELLCKTRNVCMDVFMKKKFNCYFVLISLTIRFWKSIAQYQNQCAFVEIILQMSHYDALTTYMYYRLFSTRASRSISVKVVVLVVVLVVLVVVIYSKTRTISYVCTA